LYFTDDIGIVFGLPTDYLVRFRMEDGTRVRWTRLDSLIVNAKCGHSLYLCGCVMLSGYFPCKVTIDSNLRETSDMGEAYSLLSFLKSAIPLCSHESLVMLIMTTWLSKIDDTKNG
jgi:hypothetical protein